MTQNTTPRQTRPRQAMTREATPQTAMPGAVLTQTAALLIDALRELRARRLFWITLGLSGLVVAAFAMVGVNERGLTFLWFQLPADAFGATITSESLPPGLLYRTMFASLAVPIWLSWVAVVLGLISTAGIIPELIRGGTIEAILARPIGRVRLLATKLVGGLAFMALQVGVFTVLAFAVIAVRGGSLAWEVFLAIPIVLAMFSYLFAVCVLLGLLTRSTIAALLLTMLFWMVVFVLNTGDAIAVTSHERLAAELDDQRQRIERMEANAADAHLARVNADRADEGLEPLDPANATEPTRADLDAIDPRLPARRAQADRTDNALALAAAWRRGIYLAKTALPKTQETIGLLERAAVDNEALTALGAPGPDASEQARRQQRTQQATAQAFRERSIAWILGTSLAFEAVVLALAAWIFARRDF